MMLEAPVDVEDCPSCLSRRLTRCEAELNDHAFALLDMASGLLGQSSTPSQRMVIDLFFA